MKESREFYEVLAQAVLDKCSPSDVPQSAGTRINHCQAWHTPVSVNDRLIDLVRSYNTIVAFYDIQTDCLVSIGRYTITTYQHIRKFRNNYLPNMWKTAEINVEQVNWF